MCNRFASALPAHRIGHYFDCAKMDWDEFDLMHPPSYNVTPRSVVRAVRIVSLHRELCPLSWGIVTKNGGAKPLLNLRAETILAPPRREQVRCLLPASGFYEWRAAPKEKPQPYYFHSVSGDPLAIAGVVGPGNTVSLVTTAANADVAPVHSRMPVLVAWHDFDRWLRPKHALDLDDLLDPEMQIEGLLLSHPVSKEVNSVRAAGADLIKPVAIAQRDLF